MQICKELPGNQHLLVFHFVKVDNSLTGTLPGEVQNVTPAFSPHANNAHGKVTPINDRLAGASWRRWFQLMFDYHCRSTVTRYVARQPVESRQWLGRLFEWRYGPKIKPLCSRWGRMPVCLLPVTNRHTDRHFFSPATITSDIYGTQPKTLQTVNLYPHIL